MKLPRPHLLPSFTYELPTHCGKIYVTVSLDSESLPFEVFVRFGKAGHCGAAVFDGLTRILSYGLRSGMSPDEAVKALSGISCTHGPRTCLSAVAEALSRVMSGEAIEIPRAPAGKSPQPIRSH